MILHHQISGDPLHVQLRPFVAEDASAVIACIRDAYGETYVKPYLYTEAGVVEHHACGALTFAVAETDGGEVIGITAIELSPHFSGQAEIACQIIRRAYNGYGLARPLATYQMCKAEGDGHDSTFARALGCHLISQQTLEGMGFAPCGFLLSVFDKARFAHRYQNGAYEKIPQSLAVKRGRKLQAGTIWIPPQLAPLAEALYRSLGVAYTPTQHIQPLAGDGCWDWEWNGAHSTLTLWARRCGADFAAQLSHALNECGGQPLFTANLYLNLSDPAAGAAWEEAGRQGFLFTGFLPCGRDGEYVILHQPGALPVNMDTIPHIPSYAPFVAEVRRQVDDQR